MLHANILVFTTRLHSFISASGRVCFWCLVWLHATETEMYSLRALKFVLLLMFKSYFFKIEIASEGLKYRVFEVSLADLQNDNDAERSFRKFRLIAEDVQGRNVLTNFHGMDLTTDKLRSMVKKWQVGAGCTLL